VPYFGSAGWYACKEGTLDMYRSAVDARANVRAGTDIGFREDSLVSEPVFATVAERTAWEQGKSFLYADPDGVSAVGPIVKTHFLTGQAGDPTTIGPWSKGVFGGGQLASKNIPSNTLFKPGQAFFSTTDKPGDQYWLVRGLPVKCGAGFAPTSVLLQKFATGDVVNYGPELCEPLPATTRGTKGNILLGSGATLAQTGTGTGTTSNRLTGTPVSTSAAISATIDFSALVRP
jgi:hypothetical protein